MKNALEDALGEAVELFMCSFEELMSNRNKATAVSDRTEQYRALFILRAAFDEALGVTRDQRKNVRSDHE